MPVRVAEETPAAVVGVVTEARNGFPDFEVVKSAHTTDVIIKKTITWLVCWSLAGMSGWNLPVGSQSSHEEPKIAI